MRAWPSSPTPPCASSVASTSAPTTARSSVTMVSGGRYRLARVASTSRRLTWAFACRGRSAMPVASSENGAPATVVVTRTWPRGSGLALESALASTVRASARQVRGGFRVRSSNRIAPSLTPRWSSENGEPSDLRARAREQVRDVQLAPPDAHDVDARSGEHHVRDLQMAPQQAHRMEAHVEAIELQQGRAGDPIREAESRHVQLPAADVELEAGHGQPAAGLGFHLPHHHPAGQARQRDPERGGRDHQAREHDDRDGEPAAASHVPSMPRRPSRDLLSGSGGPGLSGRRGRSPR